ncbi:MAG TPA: HAMP domain-containing sensor histidine kinase [Candidatus Saccharimonadia bacterium]|jgi:signal transduction histidine kinase|nr:HAMP domain-containing sensor histidine kinase [Candidatus Saccharimonadia bacterium]
MIKSAVFKLTLWYLGIICILSSFFSVALYHESFDQLAVAANRQRTNINRLLLPDGFEDRRQAFLQQLDDQLSATQNQLILRLLVLNLATLLLGGVAAYALARRTLKPIQDSMEAQGRFTADASHELRTPLTAMRSEIEVALRDKKLDAKDARMLLSSNLEEIAKLEALSAGLLRLARFENGLDPAVVTSVPVRELFDDVAKRYKAKLAARGLKLEITAGDETVAGDQASLTELVAVLVDNAVKYSPEGGAIRLESTAAGHDVRLSVADQGSGIAAEDLPHIFDRFYRADRSRTRGRAAEADSYGLGLSIAKRITDVHHGAIAAESTAGQGTTFRVKLPVEYAAKKPLF